MMEDEAKRETVDPWNVFVLATIAPLGGRSDVHLSPNLTQDDLGIASAVPLPLEHSEFLVASILDPTPSEEPSTPIILTNHRIFWFDLVDHDADGHRTPRPTLRGRVATYRELSPHPAPQLVEGRWNVELGGGRSVSLPKNANGLAEILTEALRGLGDAARHGVPAVLDPERAKRIAEVVPKVIAADARLRSLSGDVAAFHNLLSVTPRVYVTPMLVAACVGVFAAMTATGVDPTQPSLDALVSWGANDAIRVAMYGETWRLPASVFLHGGLFHLAMNMWCLISVGPFVERLYGHLGFAALYLAAGVGGAVASMATPPARVSVGASGAIFGVLGALLAFLVVRRRAIPASIVRPLRSSALSFVAFNIVFGSIFPAIDQAAHLGGLASGFLAGIVLAGPWAPTSPRRPLPRSVTLVVVVVAVTTAVALGAAQWRAGTISPKERLRDFAIQLQPVYEQFAEGANRNAEILTMINFGGGNVIHKDLPKLLSETLKDGEAVLDAASRIRTSEPRIQELADLFVDAQREQNAALKAAQQYVATGDRSWIEGPEGYLARISAAVQIEKDRQELERAYLRDSGLEELLESK